MDESHLEPRGLARLFPVAWLAVAGSQTRARPNRPIAFTPSRVEPIAPPPPPLSSGERPSASARLAQLAVWVLVAIGWAIFATWWVVVLRRESAGALAYALGVLAAIVVVCTVLTATWTRYNQRIARNGKRGHASLYIPMRWERDALGRPIQLPAPAIASSAPDVRVVMRGGVKVYVAHREAAP